MKDVGLVVSGTGISKSPRDSKKDIVKDVTEHCKKMIYS